MQDELNTLIMNQGPAGDAVHLRGVYYLGTLIEQMLTEFVDEEGLVPPASWHVASVDEQPFSVLQEKYQGQALWGILSFVEQPGGALILADEASAKSLVAAPANKPLSDDHLSLVDGSFQRLADAMAQAWSDVANLESQLGVFPEAPDITELQEIFMGLTAKTPMITTSFRVHVPSQPLARIVLAIPQPYLIPLASSLEAAAEMTYAQNQGESIDERIDYLGDVPTPVVVYLGRTTMTVAELHSLEEEDVIVLDQPFGAPLLVELGGGSAGGARILAKPGTTPDGLRKAVQVVRLGSD